MKINVKNNENLKIPTAGTPQSSGYDVVATSDPEIIGTKDGEYWKCIDYIQYKTTLFIAPQTDRYNNSYHILVHPRSSISKYNLVLANSIALIDNDYRGEILLRFKYTWQPEDMFWTTEMIGASQTFVISKTEDIATARKTILGKVNQQKIYQKNDKIGQLVAEITNPIEWEVVADLSDTIRGAGGFGSTTIPIHQPPETPKVPIKTYETRVDLMEQWKKLVGPSNNNTGPINYETLIKEREKQI